MKHNHQLFVDIAKRVSQESTATRLKVGAVIASEGSIIDVGYNGTPAGWSTNTCEEVSDSGALVTKPEVIHAEMNALLKCAKLGKPVKGAILYITHAPCDGCAKHIIASGIKEIVYTDTYRSTLGLDILHQGGVKVTKWEQD